MAGVMHGVQSASEDLNRVDVAYVDPLAATAKSDPILTQSVGKPVGAHLQSELLIAGARGVSREGLEGLHAIVGTEMNAQNVAPIAPLR